MGAESGSGTRRCGRTMGTTPVPALPALPLGGGEFVRPRHAQRAAHGPGAARRRPSAMSGLRRIDLRASAPFFALHAAMLLAFWTGVSWTAVAICALTYLARMFAITAGFHRYFAHRTYK